MQGIVTKFVEATWLSRNVAIPPLPVLAVPTTLWAYLGGSLAQSQNMVAGAPPIVVGGGIPAFPPTGNFATLGLPTATTVGNGYLDTGVLDDTKSFTLITVARKNYTSGVVLPLNNNDPGGSGFGIYLCLQSTPPGIRCSINGPSINLLLSAPADADQTWFKIYVVSYDDPTFTMNIYNLTDNLTVQQIGGAFTRASSPATFWIGLNQRNTVGVGNPGDVAFVGKISGSITLTQAQQIAANIRATLALTGMMV